MTWVRQDDAFWKRIADWLPKRLVYFAVIRAWRFATIGKEYDTYKNPDGYDMYYDPKEVKLIEVLLRWSIEDVKYNQDTRNEFWRKAAP